jgi:hypothetical protein
MEKKWSNYGKWRHPELYKQLTQMNTLDKTVGAMFLANSRFKTQVEIPFDMLDPRCNIDHQERVKYEMVQRISKHIEDSFSKEIKKQQTSRGEVHSLELFILPTEALKLAVEYIISEMPQSEIDRIRTTPNQNEFTR